MGRAKSAALAALTVGGFYMLLNKSAVNETAQSNPTLDFVSLANNAVEEIGNAIQSEYMPVDIAMKNIQAFLMTIRTAEGTQGPNGYRTLFGQTLFDGYADHPRIAKSFTSGGKQLWTTAAGAYQFLAVSPIPGGGMTRMDTWDRLKRKLNLIDFSPASQDAAAIALIDEAGALADVRAGRFAVAVDKIRRIWASMPGAGYSQPEKTLQALAAVYSANGGAFA